MANKKITINNFKTKFIIFIILTCLVCSTFLFYDNLEKLLNDTINPPINTKVDDCELKVHFIDVGQGDGIFIEFPDNKTMLVDAGHDRNEDDLLNYLNKVYGNKKHRNIDYFVITHQDQDHVGGADVVFDNFNVLNFYRPNVFTDKEINDYGYTNVDVCNTNCYTITINKMYAENCNWFISMKHDNLFNLASDCPYSIKCLSPIDEKYTDPNNYSPIMIIEYQNRKIMLTGDAEIKVENQLLDNYSNIELKCDVLKLGHHGSNTSTSFNFLKAVNPKYAVISVGANNSYKHPNKDVLARVNTYIGENNVFRTDLNGNIVVGLDKDNLQANKAEIKISTHKGQIMYIKIELWCVIVSVEALIFIVLFMPAKIKDNKKKEHK